jgi:galactose mutarotase-like enzyme
VTAATEETRFQDEPALRLTSGRVSATFVPGLGMTGVSLRNGSAEHLALPGGLDALRHGRTTGLPLLAPWANRLSGRVYRVGRVRVDMHGLRLGVDEHHLPIHGLLVGRKGWRVERLSTRGTSARVHASIDVDAKAFPFAHRIDITASVRETGLTIDTSITPTGKRAVPVAFGWHPYLQLPGVARSSWNLHMPGRRHLGLDSFGIPDGEEAREVAEHAPIARRRFDDLYALGRDRRLAFSASGGRRVELHCKSGYPYAQVWVPAGKSFAALEPMAAPTNALVDGNAPLVPPGDSFTATFTLTVA